MAKTKTNAPVGPWREGRPSFKAFYPEIVLLTIVTIAFIALAARLSCSGTKPKSENAAPKPVSSATLSLTRQAFAQDGSLDAPEAAASGEPIGVATALAVTSGDESSAVSVSTASEAAASVPKSKSVAPSKAKMGKSAKILTIWGVCLAIPAFLWIWRAWAWIGAVYGVRFEIRCDADNPKATTFLVTRGIFNKKTDSMHIAQIKDIQSSQSIMQKYFQGGVGTIRLFTQDLTDGVLVMKNMEEPSRVFNALDELRRRYWALGGIGGVGVRTDSAAAESLEEINDAM